MKKIGKIVSVVLSLFAVISLFPLSACQKEKVVPAAWVKLVSDRGYAVYTTDMYGYTDAHIYLYTDETCEEVMLKIEFTPRILGPETVDGVKTTLVDLSYDPYTMYVYVYKTAEIYSEEKEVYLNGKKLTPAYEERTASPYFITLQYVNFGLVRGNPNGKINGVINTIEYK